MLSKCFPEFIKLAEIAIIHILGSVENERTRRHSLHYFLF
jgi:hypothetical protein